MYELQCHLALDAVEVDERHTFRILLDLDVALISVDDEVSGIHPPGGIVCDPPDLGNDLQRDDVGDTPFVQPHSFDFSEVTHLVHGSRPTVAMTDEPATDLVYVVE